MSSRRRRKRGDYSSDYSDNEPDAQLMMEDISETSDSGFAPPPPGGGGGGGGGDKNSRSSSSSSHRHHHHHKKSRKHKKEKKKRRRRSRTRSRSRSPDGKSRRHHDDDDDDRDREEKEEEELEDTEVEEDDDDDSVVGGFLSKGDDEGDRNEEENYRREQERRRRKLERARRRRSTPEIDEDMEKEPIIINVDEYEDGEVQEEDKSSSSRIQDDNYREDEVSKDEMPTFSASAQESLSVEETNKLRISLGLAPLKMAKTPEEIAKEDENHEFKEFEMIPSSTIGERHKPAENLTQKTRAEKIKAKLAERREKRKQESRLKKVKGLGESDSEDDDAKNWVERQKIIQKEKEAAKKRAKMLEEMDEEFGVNELIESSKPSSKTYSSKDLSGLKVEHSAERFNEGRDVILTLKDADVLDEEGRDTLINVNIVDDEKTKRNLENIKKSKNGTGYNPYDQEEIDEITGEVKKKNLLDKYDEDIDGNKGSKDSFSIGSGGNYNEEEEIRRKKEEIRAKLKSRNVVSLELPEAKVASDYYTKDEVVSFKKPKKKKKVKKRVLKADDLLSSITPNDSGVTTMGSRNKKNRDPEDEEELDQDVGEIKDLSNVKVSVDNEEDNSALSKAQKLKDKIRSKLTKKKVDIADRILAEKRDNPSEETNGAELIGTFADDEKSNKKIVLNETSEFCRNLGAWQSSVDYSAEPSSSSTDILDEFEDSLKSGMTKRHEESRRGRWNVDPTSDSDDEIMEIEPPPKEKSTTILDEEPNLHQGVGAAIQMAMNKGYWDTNKTPSMRSNLKHLESQNYMIEDKNHDDRDRRGRSDRYGGPSVPFSEKSDYTPNVKLEYIDDSGRKLNTKEAFRFMSHKFHGKGSGKLKSEKRMKKVMEESMMRNMSSTDTPLGTVEKMKKRQKESSTPYLVLTGKNQTTDVRK